MIHILVHDKKDTVGVAVVEGIKAGQELVGWVMEDDSTIKVKAPMVLGKSYAGKALKVQYFGDYAKVKPAYDDIMQYMTEKGLSNNGSPWEVYITDPMKEKDTLKWQTDVYMPIK